MDKSDKQHLEEYKSQRKRLEDPEFSLGFDDAQNLKATQEEAKQYRIKILDKFIEGLEKLE